jgi:hypothetical protein
VDLGHGCAKDKADYRAYQIVRGHSQWDTAGQAYTQDRKETRHRKVMEMYLCC